MDDQVHTLPAEPPATFTARSKVRNRGWKLARVAIIVVILMALTAGGVKYWLYARNFVSTDDAFIDAYSTQVSPRISGQVTSLLFADNQHVTTGQILLEIDPRDYQTRLDQAKAQEASTQASLQQARAQLAVQQANARQADANLSVAQADFLQARQDFDRFKAINPAAVTRQQVDAATATFHGADAKVQAAQANVGAASAQIQAAQAGVTAAEASLQQARANVANAELQLSYCTLLAPVTGIVTHRTVASGNFVIQGQPLFAVVQDGRWITANFKETQLADMHPGQPVDISIDAVPGATFHGTVDSFQSGTGTVFSTLPAENATGNYVKIVQRVPVKILFTDPGMENHNLSPGMSVVPSVRVR